MALGSTAPCPFVRAIRFRDEVSQYRSATACPYASKANTATSEMCHSNGHLLALPSNTLDTCSTICLRVVKSETGLDLDRVQFTVGVIRQANAILKGIIKCEPRRDQQIMFRHPYLGAALLANGYRLRSGRLEVQPMSTCPGFGKEMQAPRIWVSSLIDYRDRAKVPSHPTRTDQSGESGESLNRGQEPAGWDPTAVVVFIVRFDTSMLVLLKAKLQPANSLVLGRWTRAENRIPSAWDQPGILTKQRSCFSRWGWGFPGSFSAFVVADHDSQEPELILSDTIVTVGLSTITTPISVSDQEDFSESGGRFITSEQIFDGTQFEICPSPAS
ncbi:hypothetical protein B0H65DRAFT_438340 [Neurospora tetraspora]|uniref:Uncharacterized protein n=1 Tax=Neurospora tetraspora TaxID=94610 RepID=A0AAE0JNX4_9PEZI|nr:hypothetical protein B0H65DRAFT_438340 [Neurospora tetraspora]